jgi:hypothetical protein
VSIDGTPVTVALHTANTFNMIGASTAQRLNLPKKPVPGAATVNDGYGVITSYAEIDSLKVGSLTFKGPSALISSNPAFAGNVESLRDAVGSLGIDFFSGVDLELDLAAHKLRIFSQDHCAGVGAYWAKEYSVLSMKRDKVRALYFSMEVEGRQLDTVLSTGSVSSRINEDIAKNIYHFDRKSPGILKDPDQKGGESYYRAMELTSQGLSIMNARVTLAPDPGTGCLMAGNGKKESVHYENCWNRYPFLLGMEVLQRLHLYFSNKEKLLYYTINQARVPSAPADGDTAPTAEGRL